MSEEAMMVWVVDDDHDIVELVNDIVVGEGYQCEMFQSGAAVLARLKETKPDIILLDYAMPEMTGLSCLTKIREQYGPEELPAVMITAFGTEIYDFSDDDIKAEGHVTKPLEPEKLINAIHNAFGEPEEDPLSFY